MKRLILTVLLVVASGPAAAELRIFACEPEWAALADEVGGDLVATYSATTALQDPHYIQARPSLIAKVRRADLVICSGAQLEIGWLPALLQKANNRKVMPGTDGYFDIHPQGNPHIQTNPHNLAAVAKAVARRLAKIDPENTETYESNLNNFMSRWQAAIQRWEATAEPLRGKRVITHHKSWVYLVRWLGLEEVAHLEAIAGLPPTATHLSRLTTRFGDGGADVIVRSPYQDAKPSRWLSERISVPAVVLPLTVGGTDEAVDLFGMFDDILARLTGALDSA